MKYFIKNYKYLLCLFLIFLSFNLYFIFLIPNTNEELLIYLDILLLVCIGIFLFIDINDFYKREHIKKDCLDSDDVIYENLVNLDNIDIAEHDVKVLEQEIQAQIEMNQDLQDFITKWCHEVKIPLSAAMLMDEKIEDPELKIQLKEQLEKIKQYLNSALVSCKVQGAFYDIQVSKIKLKDCVNTSIKNNRYFLINNQVELQIDIHNEYIYSDSEWIVYIIDQLIANAIKYDTKSPKIHIWSEQSGDIVRLYIKDFGEGIKDYDLPRIFDRGYVGSNHHNGKYKSTGMGLYMVMLMIKKLGHQISVESTYQENTCFCITFKNIEKHFNL